MKKIMIAAMLFLASQSFAQEKMIKTADESIKETANMVSNLALTPEQKGKVEVINNGIAQKNELISKNTLMTAEQKEQSFKENEQARLSMLKGVLTDEQYQKYTAPVLKPMRKAPVKASENFKVKEGSATEKKQ
jgi:uncharacterized GH25 family protein